MDCEGGCFSPCKKTVLSGSGSEALARPRGAYPPRPLDRGLYAPLKEGDVGERDMAGR